MSSDSAPARDGQHRLCIIVPVLNEAAVLPLLMPRLDAALATLDADVRVLFSSTTAALMQRRMRWRASQTMIRASASFGSHETAARERR